LREVATAAAADGAVATAVAARATADYESVQQQRIESIIAGPLNLSVDPQFKNDLLAAYAQDDQSDESIPAASAVDDQSDESNSATAVYKQFIKDVEDGHKLFKSSERKMDEPEVLLNESLWDLQSMSPYFMEFIDRSRGIALCFMVMEFGDRSRGVAVRNVG
jgi:hypothetical protein